MTEAQMAAALARLDAATPGPWEEDEENSDGAIGVRSPCDCEDDEEDGHYHWVVPYLTEASALTIGHNDYRDFSLSQYRADCDFIAHARQDLPMLLDAVRERDNVIHDILQDGGYQAGRNSAFSEVLEYLRFHRREQEKDYGGVGQPQVVLGRIQAYNTAIEAVLGMAGVCNGQRPAPLPPEAAREEAARLRKLLRVALATSILLRHERITQLLEGPLEGTP